MFAIPAGITPLASGLPTLPLLVELGPLAASLAMVALAASIVGWMLDGRGAIG